MDASTREAVARRADGRCEYCLLRQEYSELRHHVEHIVAKQHEASSTACQNPIEGNLKMAGISFVPA